MDRQAGLSVRLKLTLSYVGLLMVAGVLILTVVWVFLLRYVPADDVIMGRDGSFVPDRDDLVRAFVPAAAWALTLLLVVALLGGWILAGRMLAPLGRITHATRVAATGSLSHRIDLAGPRDEFRELADAFDAMLARLEAHVAEQRRFAANASHELRTPLATTQALLDVALRDPQHDERALLDQLRTVNARAIDLTQALLVLSRADSGSFALERVDLSLLAEEATETLLPLAEEHGVTIETSSDVVHAVGSPALLLQLTTDLVHNAIVHNLPEGGAVWIRMAARDGRVILVVENTGPTLAPGVVATLTEPFRRGTERVHGTDGGVGLGLAIVQSIARAHDADLTLTAREGGGLSITVAMHPGRPERGSH